MTTRVRNHEQRHYCRECVFEIEPTSGSSPPAHFLYVTHYVWSHPVDETNRIQDATRCTKYCKGRAQTDELQHGVKLYGPGSKKMSEVITLIKPYESIFPKEED